MTYTISVAGHVVTEQLSADAQQIIDTINQDRSYTFTSSYDIQTGIQNYSMTWNVTQIGSTQIPGCVSTTLVSETGSTTHSYYKVAPCTVSIATSSLPNGTANSPYLSQTLIATGGTPPYTWSVSGLPTGLVANAQTGVISGTPTQSGQANIGIQVTDSLGCTASKTLSFQVISPLAISTSSLPTSIENTPYPDTTLTASGGTAPYAWSVSGVIGLSVDPLKGILSGTPEVAGQLTETLTVTDSANGSASVALPIFIVQPYFSQQTKEAFRQASVEWQLIATFLDGLLADPICDLNPECRFTTETAIVSADAAQLACDIAASDPPDPNFTAVAQPVSPTTPALPAGTDKHVVQAFNYLFQNENMQVGYFVAMKTSLNRSQGAAVASNSKWQQTQLLAAKKYAYNLTVLQEVQPILLYLYQSALQTSGAPTIPIDPAQVNAILQNIAQNGLPPSSVQALEAVGFTVDEINLVRSMPQPSLVTSAPSYPAILVDPSLLQAIKQSQAASLPFIADRNNDLVVDCADLQSVKASLGKKIGQTGFDPRADVNGDGVVNLLDFVVVASQIPQRMNCHIMP